MDTNHFDFDTSNLTNEQVRHLANSGLTKLKYLKEVLKYQREEGTPCQQCSDIAKILEL